MNVLRRRSSSISKKPNTKVIFKKFLDFLLTDDWKLPTVNFLEKNSILFNHDQANHELCLQAHQQYTELVDTLIESFCQDANISTKDFVESSQQWKTSLTQKERKLLEPVVAAQDFNVFVPLMTRINIELQLQAVKMLEHICGVQPVSFKFSEDEAELMQSLFEEDETERYIIISVLKQSKEEFEKDEKLRRALQDAFEASLSDIQKLEKQRDEEIEQYESAIGGIQEMVVTSPSAKSPSEKPSSSKPRRASAQVSSKPPPLPPPTKEALRSASIVGDEKSPSSATKFDFKNLLNKNKTDDDEKIKQRSEYLKQQRDKLVEARQKQRELQLIQAAQTNAGDRPKTSQAARGALRGALTKNGVNEDMVEARKAIASKIREQVMNKVNKE